MYLIAMGAARSSARGRVASPYEEKLIEEEKRDELRSQESFGMQSLNRKFMPFGLLTVLTPGSTRVWFLREFTGTAPVPVI